MNEKIKGMLRTSLPLGNYWFQDESFGDKRKVQTEAITSEEAYGAPQLMKMVDNWRIEREAITKRKEKQKIKSLMRKKKNLERKTISDQEKHDFKKDMEVALQNTLKNKDDCDLLLAELEYYENEGHQILDLNPHYSTLRKSDSLVSLDSDEYPFDMNPSESTNMVPLNKSLNNQSVMKSFTHNEKTEKTRDQYPKNIVYRKLIEEVFSRLKKQQEQDSDPSHKTSPHDDNFFQESYYTLQSLYEEEMKSLNTRGRYTIYIPYSYQKFPPFPASVKELDFLSNNPLIIFREWCHFHKVSPIISKKISMESLLNDFTSTTVNNNLRLLSLCTLMHLYSEEHPNTNEKHDSETLLMSHDLQTTPNTQNGLLYETLQNTLKNSYGKLKLGIALALVLMGKSDESRGLIRSTLMTAMKGITTMERRIAAMAMAYAGIFEYSALNVILEEWKSAQQAYKLQKYLTALRWLSTYETSVIKSVAEYLETQNLHFRLYVCLTLPFMEGNLPPSVRDTLIHLMRNSNISILRLAAARVLECKQCGDCVQDHITASLNFSNISRALEVIQLSLMLKHIDPKIGGILLPCINSDIKYVKMIGLSVTGQLHINNPMFEEAICTLVTDKDSDIREAAFNTLCMINAQGTDIETLVLVAVANERNETVYKAILKLIEETGMRGEAVQKSLQKSYKRTHSKENQLLILKLLEIIVSEIDDASHNKSPPHLTTAEAEIQRSVQSNIPVSNPKTVNSVLENVDFTQETFKNKISFKFLPSSGHPSAETVVKEKWPFSETRHFLKSNLHPTEEAK